MMTKLSSNTELPIITNSFRKIFWPIYNFELGKFIPMAGLIFCVLFNQNILRILKDSILISEISAEVTAFAKVYAVTPVAALFVIIYSKLTNIWSFEKIYNYLIGTFTIFFFIFAFFIYPNAHLVHINAEKVGNLMTLYPNFKWYFALVGNWGYVLFYTFAELWPNIFYVLLFWQLANEITSTEEAKRFYTLFSLFGNSSLIFVGLLMMNLSSDNTFVKYFFTVTDNKLTLVQVSTCFLVISSLISCLLLRFISCNVMTHGKYYSKKPKTDKPTLGLIDSFKYIVSSKYLWLLLICSASFSFSMNLVEAVWKSKIKELYPTVNTFAKFNSLYILWTGIAIMIMTIIGNNVIRRYNWFVAAIIAPLIILITGILFFFLIVFDRNIVSFLEGTILMTPLALAVIIGAIQNILAKGAKFSIWDATREMLYIPLDENLKTKGKAAVDVVSAKVGKASSGLLQSIIFTLVPTATYSSISPLLMIVFTIVCIIWLGAIKKIYHEYKKIA